MRLSRYETLCLEGIERWERQRYTGLDKHLLDCVSTVLASFVDAVGPKALRSIETTVRHVVKEILQLSTHGVDVEKVRARARANGIEMTELSDLWTCHLYQLDKCNRRHIRFYARSATALGAVTGLGGVLLAAVELSALLFGVFRLVQEIAFCYGFDPTLPLEKHVILQVVLGGMGNSDMKEKALAEIKRSQRAVVLGTPEDADGFRVLSAKAMAEYVEHLAVAIATRVIPRSLPIVSVVLAAHSSHEMITQTSRTAFMVYRKRFIKRKEML